MMTIEIYQSISPEVGTVLLKEELLPKLLSSCAHLYQVYRPTKKLDLIEVNDRFIQLAKLVTLEKQMIISLEKTQQLDWQGLVKKMENTYQQLALIQLSEEISETEKNYYINFVPIALKEADFPFTISMNESLRQQLSPLISDLLGEFKREIEVLTEEFIFESEPVIKKTILTEKQLLKKEQQNNSSTIEESVENNGNKHELAMYREELAKEKNVKERMKLANQKLELLMEQLERNVVGSAVRYFSEKNKNDSHEDWYKIIKIDLREYSQLYQKAKYLERIWVMNQSLETKSEKMVISDQEWTYEREQVRQIKEVSNPEEIFFMIDECEMIGRRVKVREHPFWGKPNVRIMRMDYETLTDKAAYFDLLQAENYLLEQVIPKDKISISP